LSIILNEKEYAEKILETKEVGSKPSSTLYLLGKYYRKFIGLDATETFDRLNDFMKDNYKNYNPVLWETIIEDISKKSNKYNIREINSIGITKNELDTISLLNDITLEKLVFSMLCHAKLYNISSDSNNGWINTKIPEIFKTARINVKYKNDKMLLVYKLLNTNILETVDDGVIIYTPLISISKKNTNTNIQLLFIDDGDDYVLNISDFRELGYEYLLYLGENYSRCADCGALFKQNKNNAYKYCIKHRGYQSIESKTIKCVDCKKDVVINAKDNQTTRCTECYEIYRKNKVRENVHKCRERKKNQNV
jgi:DNA-directed RNA polymerase subunit RPC12/RpoP